MTDTIAELPRQLHEPSEVPVNLAAALVAFQAAVSNIGKSKTADTGKYKYSFADLADIFEEIRPHLAAAGLAVTQALVRASAPGLLGIDTKLWHASGETYSEVAEFPIGKDPQQIGSATTYFKRYALSAMLGLATEEDDDGKAASAPRQQPRPKRPTEVDQAVARVQAALKSAGETYDSADAWFQETYNKGHLADCTNVKGLTETAEHYEAIATAKDNLGATEV